MGRSQVKPLLWLLPALLLIGLLWALRARTTRQTSKATVGRTTRITGGAVSPPMRKSSRWHSVSIRPGRESCIAAQALASEVHLASKAPQLPLAACDVSRCDCRYQHLGDRRDDDDRRSPLNALDTYGGIGLQHQIDERRNGGDRRS